MLQIYKQPAKPSDVPSPDVIRITFVSNPFSQNGRTISNANWTPFAKVFDYIRDIPEIESGKFVVNYNDKIYSIEDSKYVDVERGSSLTVGATVRGGGKWSGVIMGVITAAIGVGLIIFSAGALAPIGLPLIMAGSVQIWGSLLSMWLAPTLSQTIPQSKTRNSPTFDLEGYRHTVVAGMPIPALYGQHKEAGQILNVFYKVNAAGESVIYQLIAVSHGEIQDIAGIDYDVDGIRGPDIPDAIKINNVSAKNFGNDVSISVRIGSWNQKPIEGFSEATSAQSSGQTCLTGIPVTLTTDDICSAFEVNLFFPGGLFKINSGGAIINFTVQYLLEWRESGTVTWTGSRTVTLTQKIKGQWSAAERVDNPLGVDAGGTPIKKILDVQITRLTAADSATSGSVFQWQTMNEILPGAQSYDGLALLGLVGLGTSQLNGSAPTVTSAIRGLKLYWWDGQSSAEEPVLKYGYFDDVTTKNDLEIATDTYVDFRRGTGPTTNEKISFFWTQDGTREFRMARIELRKYGVGLLNGSVSLELRSGKGSTSGTLLATSVAYDADLLVGGTTGGITKIVGFALADPIELTDGTEYSLTLVGTYTASSSTYLQVAMLNATFGTYDTEFYTSSWAAFSAAAAYRTRASLYFRDQVPGENNAWVAMDIITNQEYGAGLWFTLSNIDLGSFREFAGYCDDCYDEFGGVMHHGFRWRFNYVFDNLTTVWDALVLVCSLGRSAPYRAGRTIRIVTDKPSPYVAIINTANIKKNSMVVRRTNTKNLPGVLAFQFRNKEIDWSPDLEVIPDPNVENGPNSSEIKNIFGITDPAQVLRTGRYLLNSRALNSSLTFVVSIEQLRVLPGDVVAVSHILLQTATFGGRLVDATASSVTLDRADVGAFLDAYGSGGRLIVQTTGTGDLAFQERNLVIVGSSYFEPVVAEGGTTIHKIFPDTNFDVGDVPVAGNRYVVCPDEDDSPITQWRVLETKHSGTQEIEITCSQYDPTGAVYNDAPVDIGPFTIDLPNNLQIPDSVTYLKLTESHSLAPDGALRTSIDVSFNKPRGDHRADIWFRSYDTPDSGAWSYGGHTYSNFFQLYNVGETGKVIQIAVTTASSTGVRGNIANAPREQITVRGPFVAPPPPTNLTATKVGDLLILRWTASGTSDAIVAGDGSSSHFGAVAGYEVRQGPHWASARVLTKLESGTQFMCVSTSVGTNKFLVAAVSRAGIHSSVVSVDLTVVGSFLPTFATYDARSANFTGTLTNFSISLAEPTIPKLVPSASSATYQVPTTTMSARGYWKVYVDVTTIPYDPVTTLGMLDFALDSDIADRWVMSGWAENPKSPELELLEDVPYAMNGWWGAFTQMNGQPVDVENQSSYAVEYRASTDGSTFGSWTPLACDPIDFVKVDIRVVLTGTSTVRQIITNVVIRIVRFIQHEHASMSSSAAGLATYTFTTPFQSAPNVVMTAEGLINGERVVMQSPSATSVRFAIQNAAGTFIAKTVHIVAEL